MHFADCLQIECNPNTCVDTDSTQPAMREPFGDYRIRFGAPRIGGLINEAWVLNSSPRPNWAPRVIPMIFGHADSPAMRIDLYWITRFVRYKGAVDKGMPFGGMENTVAFSCARAQRRAPGASVPLTGERVNCGCKTGA